jgi:glutamyl-tRNA reductase
VVPIALGLSHATAPLDVRERVAFTPHAVAEALRDLTQTAGVAEAAILSTCNRTEVYFAGGDAADVESWLTRFHGLSENALEPYRYEFTNERAVTHAFRVASGLESMVLGEPQILGQMKQAVRSAESAGSLGLVLNRLFQRTFAVAKDVRTRTEVGTTSISMAAAAVKLAERIFPSISDQRVLFIGAGEMIELAASHFASRRPKSVTVANRTLEHGHRLASRIGGTVITLHELPERLHEFDIVVTCTASTLPIIGKGVLERTVKERCHAPLFIVDLGVPRDVEPEVAELDDVFLFSIDDLQVIVRENLSIRKEAVHQAERIIAEQTEHFLRWLDGRAIVPTIEALAAQYEKTRAAEVDRALAMLEKGQPSRRVIEGLARGLANKLLHAPVAALHEANGVERAQLVAALSRIYSLARCDGDAVGTMT